MHTCMQRSSFSQVHVICCNLLRDKLTNYRAIIQTYRAIIQSYRAII